MSLLTGEYSLTYDLDQKRRRDWSGTQKQTWTSPQRKPQKTKFPYMVKTKKGISTGRKGGAPTIDLSGGKWYFEEELIFATPANKRSNNVYMDGYTGGLILMTKYEARDMGLNESQVIANYRSDEAVKKNADKYGYEAPHYFFNYRKDGSIESKYTPPPPPPPVIKYIEVPVEVPAPPPKVEVPEEPVFISKPEPVIAENQRVAKVSQTLDMKWILLALVGVGLLVAIIFTLRGRK